MSEEKNDSGKRKGLPWGLIVVLGILLINTIGMLTPHLLPALRAYLSRPGILVTIRNDGPTTLRSVVLHVTGASYQLGDIEPRMFAEAVVKATGESHLEIEFTDTEGRTGRLNAGGYFEPGYQGTIRVSIKDGAIDENEQRITVR